jgi:hypothetical protein
MHGVVDLGDAAPILHVHDPLWGYVRKKEAHKLPMEANDESMKASAMLTASLSSSATRSSL